MLQLLPRGGVVVLVGVCMNEVESDECVRLLRGFANDCYSVGRDPQPLGDLSC